MVARIRLGYRYLWQVATGDGSPNPEHSRCKLCEQELGHDLAHYITECPVIRPFRPIGMRYLELCNYFIHSRVLEDILILHPKFASAGY